MKFGIDVLRSDEKALNFLKNKKIGLVAHPASVTQDLEHALPALIRSGLNIVCAFGPQHGVRGEKQDNMIESEDFMDPQFQIPIYSLYGKSRKPSDQSISEIDLCLFDLQDVGTRVYTFLTTLLYMMQACSKHQKPFWVLDRPNPAGRPVEGFKLIKGYESFVGAGPLTQRHGLTLGESALWLQKHYQIDLELKIISMQDYPINEGPYWGWPLSRSWVNPSPNAANPHMAKCFSGTVMLEGTTLSEARGTTRPLEMFGAPDLDSEKIVKLMFQMRPEWLMGCVLRTCYFEPTFNKHRGELCQALQIHVDHPKYNHHQFKPFRLVALYFKAIRKLYPDYPLWRDFTYEYEKDRLAIDLINGGPGLRAWVDEEQAQCQDLEVQLAHDEKEWLEEITALRIYPS